MYKRNTLYSKIKNDMNVFLISEIISFEKFKKKNIFTKQNLTLIELKLKKKPYTLFLLFLFEALT